MKPTDLTAEPEPTAASGDPAADLARETARWTTLLSQIGAEIAAPLTDAIERLTAMSAGGPVDLAGLRALRVDVEVAREAAMLAQQLARLAGGRVRQSHERVSLSDTLQSLLAHRARELQVRGIRLHPSLQPVEVIVDAPLLLALLGTALDWALSQAGASRRLEIVVDTQSWPVQGRCLIRLPDPAGAGDAPATGSAAENPADNLMWRLLEQTARTLGALHQRRIEAGRVELELLFPRTVSAIVETIEVSANGEADMATSGFSSSVNSKPLAGHHVLVLAARRDVRAAVREAVANMGLVLDFVASVEEAVEFCHDGLPHALVVDSAHAGPRFERLLASIRTELPGFACIEIEEQGEEAHVSDADPQQVARVGRDALLSALPAALVYELAREG